VGAALGRPLEWAGADERGRSPLDQLLVERLGRDPSPVGDIGEFQLAKEVEQGRLVKSNRVLCPYREIFDRFSLTITRWLDVDDPTLKTRETTPPKGTQPEWSRCSNH
jgi:hypothetical protein